MERILLVVITDTEYKAVHSRINNVEHPQFFGLAFLERGFLAGREVFLCKMGDMGSKTKGSVGATLATIIDEIKPTLVLEIGICFGLKSDFKIGDVCISKMTFDYEYQKVEDGISHNRLRHIYAPEKISSALSHFALHYENTFSIKTGNYACGDKVVNDDNLKKAIISAVPDAVVGDMESYTLALVCEEKKIPWSVIKASSDDGVNKHDDDQNRAAHNAAQFVCDFLESQNDTATSSSMEVDVDTDKNFFEGITQEITGKKHFKSESLIRNRTGLHIHHHPDMEDAWIIVYLYKAASIPEALRTLIKHLSSPPFRIDLCIVSREVIAPAKLSSYSEQLKSSGCQKVYINLVKSFIYDRVVKSFIPSTNLIPESRYVDQKVYIEGGKSISSRMYATNFIRPKVKSPITLKPISVILGQGGVGKTTLCKSIASHFDRLSEKDEYLLLITKSDVLNGYSGMPINSITDLYREYRNERTGMTSSIGDRSFEVALSSGSLVVMVDGIDEIESALGSKFNMEEFTNSIGEMNSILGSCKVFLTSRHLNSERFQSLENANVLELKGFSSEDVSEYLNKLEPSIHRAIQKLVSKIQTTSGFVNPYLLSIVARVCAEPGTDDDQIESKILDSSEPFEFVLAKLLAREIEKQSLGVSIDSYYELLDYIVVECENSLTYQDFQGYVETMLSSAGLSTVALAESYLKCLLFKSFDGRVSIDQDEYVALIRTKALYKILSGEIAINTHHLQRAMTILGEDTNDSLGVKDNALQLLINNRIAIDVVNSALTMCFEGFKPFILTKIPRAKNAIYALHQFSYQFNRPKSAAEAMSVLEMFHSGEKITGMHILGDFPALDFSGKTLEACEFIGYKKFLRCKVDSNTVFRNCRFIKSSDLYSSTPFQAEMFEEDCFMDEPMKLAITYSVDKKEGREARIRSDIKHILKVMRLGLGFNPKSLNKIKQSTSLLSGKSYETLLFELCRAGVLVVDSESGTYSVQTDHQSDAFDLCEENDAKGIIKKLINDLSN